MDTNLELHPVPHPDPQIRRVGFDLTHPYIEQCWGAVLGPSGVAMLRRMPAIWAEQVPARQPSVELAASLGIPGGTGEQNRFNRTIERLTRFGLAEWLEHGSAVEIYTEVAPVSDRALERTPEWTRRAHSRLLGEHLDGLATHQTRHPGVTDITARLDRLQHPSNTTRSPDTAIGR
jgi:hypothetical protein